MQSSDDECGHELPADMPFAPLDVEFPTRTWVEAQANEAEEGYDISQLEPRNVSGEVHHVHDTEEVTGGDS